MSSSQISQTHIKIALCGTKEVGKSTAEDYLCSKGFTPYTLSGALKKAILQILPIDEKYLYQQEFKEVPIPELPHNTGRSLMQKIGTDILRNIRDKIPELFKDLPYPEAELWVNSLILHIRKDASPMIVVSDVRLPDEYDILKKEGFIMVHIFREHSNKKTDSHITELGLKPTNDDFVIMNNGTIEEFKKSLDCIIGGIS